MRVVVILLVIGVLAGLRVAYWRVRVRAMTRAGLALRGDDPDEDGHDHGP